MPPPVQLYAELLVNIRQVSVSASFPGPVRDKTRADVVADGTALRVQHDDQTVTLPLPGRVAAAGRLPLQGPGLSSGHVTWRLPVHHAAGLTPGDDEAPAPWSAPDLPDRARVRCRACDATLVEPGRVRAWKDLPSENWAEMMEFWHCHKPDSTTPHDDGEPKNKGLADRGYGANSGLAAQTGVGLVDLTSLVLAEEDCRDLTFSITTAAAAADRDTVLASAPGSLRGLHVFCRGCRAQVGFLPLRRQQSVHLFKWQVGVDGTPTAPSVSDCVAATLVATIQRTGSSKSVLLPIDELEPRADAGEPVLHLWVLNSRIRYAASGGSGCDTTAPPSSGPRPRSAIKLLFRRIPRQEADAMLEALTSDVQEINLPRAAILTVGTLLAASNGLLPASERLFREWQIGLLDRWTDGSSTSLS